MSYNGDERRKSYLDIGERLAVTEFKLQAMEEDIKETRKCLQEIKETNIKIKTITGAVAFVTSGLWLVVTTFKEVIMHWLTGKP